MLRCFVVDELPAGVLLAMAEEDDTRVWLFSRELGRRLVELGPDAAVEDLARMTEAVVAGATRAERPPGPAAAECQRRPAPLLEPRRASRRRTLARLAVIVAGTGGWLTFGSAVLAIAG